MDGTTDPFISINSLGYITATLDHYSHQDK